MSEERKYQHHLDPAGDPDVIVNGMAVLIERLEAIADGLDGLERGLRNLALMSGLDRVAKNPSLAKELVGMFSKAAAGKETKPTG